MRHISTNGCSPRRVNRGAIVLLVAMVALGAARPATAESDAAPVNDHFANAQVISGASGSVTGSNLGATAEAGEPEHAGTTATSSVWYRWTAPKTTTLHLTTESSFSLALAVYTGSSVTALTPVAARGEFDTTFSFSVTQGVEYRIAVDGYWGGQGTLTLTWGQPPANDLFADAQPISGASGSVSGSNLYATAEPGEPEHAGTTATSSVWYRWTAPKTTTLHLETESSFSLALAVYTGSSVTALTLVASRGQVESTFSFPVTQGVEYRIAVDGYWNGQGTLTLAWHGPPANDLFADAQLISGASGSVTGSNVHATAEAGEPAHAGSQAASSVWYSWTAPSSTAGHFTTAGSDISTALAVYTGSSVSTLTPVASNGHGGTLKFNATAGTEYRIAVDGWHGSQGTIALAWFPGPANDYFAHGQAIMDSAGSLTASNVNAGKEAGEPEHAGVPGGHSIWYRWTPPLSGLAKVNTIGSDFDTTLAVYTGTAVNALTLVAADDNKGGNHTSGVRFSAAPGVEYHIAVDGSGGAVGSVKLAWTQTEQPVTSGGSIVHIQKSDVWLASPDGAKQVRVTSDGATPSPDGKGSEAYTNPSQSDDGKLIVAVHNQREGHISLRGYLWVMDRRGTVLAKFAPPQFEWLPGSCSSWGYVQNPRGIRRAEISPDGTKIVYEPHAYTFDSRCRNDSWSQVSVVNIDGSGHWVEGSGHSVIQRASDGTTHRMQDPSWVTSSRLLVNSTSFLGSGVTYVDLPDVRARDWYSSSDGGNHYPDLEADKLASVEYFFTTTTLHLWTANGGPPAPPKRRCAFSDPAGDGDAYFGPPSWAPDGAGLAWMEYGGDMVGDAPGEGIWVSNVGDLATTCPVHSDAQLIVPGGVYPFWGPAPVTSPTSAVADFDGNGTSDRSVYRDGAWHVQGQPTAFFGLPGDIPVPADYDGNGTTDRAVYRDGAWYVSDQPVVYWGLAGDIPVPADYDGDGDAEPAVYRPAVGGWYVEGQEPVFFGLADDIPVPADYDGNGTTDRAVYRDGAWYIHGQPTVFLGLAAHIPVPADYDGDGTTDPAVYADGAWYIRNQPTVFYGLAGHVPVPADYDGDGTTDPAVYADGAWYVHDQSTAFWGLPGDTPLHPPHAIYRRFF